MSGRNILKFPHFVFPIRLPRSVPTLLTRKRASFHHLPQFTKIRIRYHISKTYGGKSNNGKVKGLKETFGLQVAHEVGHHGDGHERQNGQKSDGR